MHYVYLIQSEVTPERYYCGLTDNVQARLTQHNAGKSIHTAKFRPWKLTTYLAFTDKSKAVAFELYLKTGSGRAFAQKRL